MLTKKNKIVFFGTHCFAVTILNSLLENKNLSVELVITQPDKPAGRKSELTPPQVKIFAKRLGLNIDQPESLRNYVLQGDYDLGVTAQYGLIIPKHILETPKYGILNVHTSLLPKYRGASPIQSTIISGEKETGVTIMKMDAGLDTGPILLQKKIEIALDDMCETLDKKLADLGAKTLNESLLKYISGELKPTAQNETQATLTKQLNRDSGKIDWSKSGSEIYNLYRGLTPWPGIWTNWNGKRLKLLKIKPAQKQNKPGEVNVENNRVYVGCGSDSIEILELQLEGKRAVGAHAFTLGHDIQKARLN